MRELTLAPHGLYVTSPDGGSRRQLDSEGRGSPNWSPDGRSIAYECGANLCVYTEGSGIRKLGAGSTPAWSPDGRQIVFALLLNQSPADLDGGIFVMAADGSGRREIVSKIGSAFNGGRAVPIGSRVPAHARPPPECPRF